MKHWKLLIVVLTATFAVGCSTYKTNTDAEFDSTGVNGLPVIHVGDIEETPEKYTYLGWVEAEVSKPTPFHASPTEEQADIALALKGQELGADAVVFVSYQTEMFGMKIIARGQAIQLEKGSKYVRALPVEKEESNPGMYRSSEKTVSKTDSRPKGVIMVPKQPIVKPPSQMVEESVALMPLNTDTVKVLDQKAAEKMSNANPQTASGVVETASAACPEAVAAPKPKCESNGYHASLDKNSLYMMRSNAEFIFSKAKDKESRQAASRLLDLLNQYLAELDTMTQAKH